MIASGQPTRRHRRGRGSAIAEFGPALWVLFFFFFFPMIDMLSVAMSYGFVMVLNYNQVHEAALLPRSIATKASGAVMSGIPQEWENGMGKFVKQSGTPQTQVTYRDGEQDGNDKVTDQIVSVQTTVICNPFLTIPIPVWGVPGLNAPITFVVLSERPMENPDDPNQ